MNSRGFVQKSLILGVLCGAINPGFSQTPSGLGTASIAPGPPMWKVSRDDHSLWIFAILTPLEAGVNWQSDEVESVIEQAQEYIYIKSPEPKIPVNPLKLINGLRLVMKIRNNPDEKTLEEVIPADLYARLSRLVELYQIPDMEETRPYYAADSLRGYAVIANKLTEDHGVGTRIEDLVGNHPSIIQTPINLGPEYLDYDFLKEAAERMAEGISLDDEIDCLELSVASVETDVDGMHLRARAWAEGNVDVLRQNRSSIDVAGACGRVLFTSELLEEADANWLQAAELALANNTTTFAVLELSQLLDGDGLLERLRAKGYTLDEP